MGISLSGSLMAQSIVGRWHSHVKRNAVVAGGQGFEVSADLVADVPGGRHPVGAHDHHVHLAALHEVAPGVVGDHGIGNPVLGQLPGGEQALITRAGFIDPNMNRNAGIVGR